MTEILVVVGIALAVSALCSVLEAVLLSVPASHVAVLRRRSRAGAWLWAMRQDLDEPVAAILTLNTISHTVGAAVAGALALEVFGSQWMAAFSAALTLAILLFSEILPKTLGARYSRALAIPSAWVLRGLRLVLRPVLIPLAAFNRLISGRGDSGPTVSRAELEVLAEIGRQEGTIDDDEWRIVSRTMRLHRIRIEHVMVPRNEMVAVPADATVDEARARVFAHGHTRLPVYGRDLDDIVGVLLAADLGAPTAASAGALARPALFLPAAARVDDVIARLRAERQKLALVVDEFGGVAGLVTLTDLLGEIVGLIADEHDDPPEVEWRDDGEALIDGSFPLRELGRAAGLHLDAPHIDTVAGYLLHRLGRVPSVGDRLRVDGGDLVVEELEGRRIRRVGFRPRGGTAAPAAVDRVDLAGREGREDEWHDRD